VSTPEHLDRYALAVKGFKAATGRKLNGYIFIAVDSGAEVYYGGSVIESSTADVRAMLAKVEATRTFLRGNLKRAGVAA